MVPLTRPVRAMLLSTLQGDAEDGLERVVP